MIQVSVVIPAKNRAKTLPYCLQSVLAQTLPPSEIIVVDDNSSDDTRSIVESYASRCVRYEPLLFGTGAQAARNQGIRSAQYDWIAFQDSDDLWYPRKLEAQIEELSRHDYDLGILVHCNGSKMDIGSGERHLLKIDGFSGECYGKILLQPGPMFQGILVNKERLYEIDLLDNYCPSYQEWDTSIRLAKVCKFAHVAHPLFEWVLHSGETISKDSQRDFEGFRYVLNKHKNEIIRIHGVRGWRHVKMANICLALRCGLFKEACAMLETEPFHSSIVLGKVFARFKAYSPACNRLLRYLSLLPF